MALNHLTIPEMVDLIEDWATPGTAVRQALEQEPSLVGLIPTIEQTFARLLASQREMLTLKASELTIARTRLDQRHDGLARVVHAILTAYIELAQVNGDQEQADQLLALRGFLFPAGLLIVNLSYREEAGQARMLASRMTPEIEAALTAVPVAGSTALDLVRDWLQTAAQLGRLEDQYNKIHAPVNRIALSEGRTAWMRVVTAVRTVAGLQDPMNPRIAEALDLIRVTEDAAARRLATSPAPEGEPELTDELPGDQGPVLGDEPAPVAEPEPPAAVPAAESAA